MNEGTLNQGDHHLEQLEGRGRRGERDEGREGWLKGRGEGKEGGRRGKGGGKGGGGEERGMRKGGGGGGGGWESKANRYEQENERL